MMTTNTPGNLQACFAEIEKATPQIKRAYECCEVCPRTCRVNRAAGKRGVCKAPAELRMGRAALHWWEEPCLVGDQGSGAVFFRTVRWDVCIVRMKRWWQERASM